MARQTETRLDIAGALDRAEALCQAQGVRLTPLRRRIFELVHRAERPQGAYDLMDVLAAGRRRRVAPPTVYRVLDFLIAHGLVHRLESLNAFIGCCHPGAPHRTQFLICDGCGSTVELADRAIAGAIARGAAAAGFEPAAATVEVHGRCADCRDGA
jgi:Fur family zinc uptake transcriptional regulator